MTSPCICRVEDYDFELVSFFHYGMHEEDYFAHKPATTRPSLIEERVSILSSIFAQYHRKPDIIILSSGLALSTI
jgi:hypothetical protein